MTNKRHTENRRHRPRRRGWLSLMPLLLLALSMGGLGWGLGDFSRIPMTIVFLFVSVASLFTLRGFSIEERLAVYSRGAGSTELMQMVWIFVLAGAFARTAQAMGAVNATVDLALMLLPSSILLGGIFLASCIVSLCIGTSVGTIVALVPVTLEMAARTGQPLPLLVAAVVGGSFFGDNLSFISDTTVAATRTQGCSMRDKFRTNFRIVFPAALCCFLLYLFIGFEQTAAGSIVTHQPDFWRIVPYAVVLVTALMGVNVLCVLGIGILVTGLTGMMNGSYGFGDWLSLLAQGITGMGELILISMMAGGLLAVVRKGGGVTWLVRGLMRRVHTRRGAECCISSLVSFANCCTANNTVAILSVGPIASDISRRYGVDSRRAASLLDIFSCIVQGILPYGAQLLMAGGLALLSPMQIIPYLFYPMFLFVTALLSIALSRKKRNSRDKRNECSV